MRLSSLLPVGATFLLAAAAATADVSLEEALKNFNDGAVMDIGQDGVLRSLNSARDTVLDFVQLSEPQITELLAKVGSKRSATPGV
ncbi:hypothetical protein J4E91_010909 [Alternaria rosae]|nr:hypothetical protein J4E91_010909 [Alternaria rosae]